MQVLLIIISLPFTFINFLILKDRIQSKMADTPYYHILFASFPLPALVLKPEGSRFLILDANENFLASSGKAKEELTGKYIDEECPENPQSKGFGYYISMASLQKCYASGKKEKVEFRREIATAREVEKRWYCAQSIPLMDKAGTVDVVLYTIEDITEKVASRVREKNLQEELLQHREQLLHFVDHNPDGLYSLDCNGKFTTANEGLSQLTQVSQEDLLQMDFLPFCKDREQVLGYFRRAITGNNVTFESDFVSAKGKEMILRISLVPNRLGDKIVGVYGIAKDVTGMRQSEKLVQERRKFLEVNASFIKSLLENELEDKALEEAFAIVGKTVAVDRMYYFGAEKDGKSGDTYISQKIEWTSANASAQIDNPEFQQMPVAKVEQIMGPLNKNLPFTARLSELEEGDLKDLFIDQEIRSMLLLPVFLKNQLYGFIGFDDCTRERAWSKDEIDFLQSLAHYFTNALEKKSAETTVLQKEEELRKSEQKFKALVQEGSDLIAIIDMAGNFLFISNTTSSILGATPDKFLGANVFNFIHPEDRDRVKSEFNELAVKKQKRSKPFRFRDDNGAWRWIETAATNLIDDPAVGGIVLNSRDITTIIEQAREIEQINERYRLAAAATNDLIYDWDLETNNIIRFHRGVKDIFGYSEKEIDEEDFWTKNVHPREREREALKLKQALNDKKRDTIRTEYRFRRADGTYAKVTDKGYILRNSEGKAVRIIGAATDVSDITAKEEELRLANKRFKMAMKATNEIIWDWDVKNDYVIRSEAFQKIYGYDSDQTSSVNSFWLSKISSKDRKRVRTSLFTALKNKQQKKWREEYCLKKGNGELAHLIDRGYIVRDHNGNATRVVGALLDVTESRRLIREIRKQNEGLKEIAWKQSHEVRAPLARLKGLLYLLRSGDFEDLSQKEILDHIFCSADELDRIIREIVAKSEKIEIDHKEESSSDTAIGSRTT